MGTTFRHASPAWHRNGLQRSHSSNILCGEFTSRNSRCFSYVLADVDSFWNFPWNNCKSGRERHWEDILAPPVWLSAPPSFAPADWRLLLSWYVQTLSNSRDNKFLRSYRISKMVHQERSIPESVQILEETEKHRSTGRPRSLLHPRPVACRGQPGKEQEQLCHSFHSALHYSACSSRHVGIFHGYACPANVWKYVFLISKFQTSLLTTLSQHHRLLLILGLRTCGCKRHGVFACFLGVWTGQLRLCLARDMDHRYVWTVRAPTSILNPILTANRRSLLLFTFPQMCWTLLAAGLCYLIPEAQTAHLALVALFIYLVHQRSTE